MGGVGVLSCFDFLLLKPMLKKTGCVRTPGFAPSGCRHHKHMNTGDKYTTDFSGSSGKPTALLTKKSELLCTRVLFSAASFTYDPSLTLFALYPALLPVSISYFCHLKGFWRTNNMKTFLPRAAQTRTYPPVVNSVPHNDFLSTELFSLQLSSCKKLEALKSLCIVPSVSGRDLLEPSSPPYVETVLPRNTLANSALTSHCQIISRH